MTSTAQPTRQHPLDAQETLDANMIKQFSELLRTDIRATAIASVIFVIIGLILGIAGAVVIGSAGMLSGIMRQGARRALVKSDFVAAVALVAGGMWFTSFVVVWLLPIGVAAMMFNLVTPVVLGATYLTEQQNRVLTAASVLAAFCISLLAYTQPGAGLEDGVAQWQVETIAVSYLVGHVWMFSATVLAANRIRVQTLDTALLANSELLDTERELRRSRRRLVDVADHERGRIERNIHDGAQQRLISLSVQLRLASQLAESGTAPDAAALDALHHEAAGALVELRELASGIYPSLLADRGIVDALRAAGRRTTAQVSVAADGEFELVDHVELAVYFVCLEALQNAAKHAGERVDVEVSLRLEADELHFAVGDEGPGFDPAMHDDSRGVLNMRDRVEAVGGKLHIDSHAGAGTVVSGSIPGACR